MSSSSNSNSNSNSASAASTLSQSTLDHLAPPLPPSEQLCYVHCNICDTVLAVSVPCTSLFKTVTVRCGHCTNLLPVNMRGLLLPATPNQFHHLGHNFFSPQPPNSHNPLLLPDHQEIPMTPTPNFLMNNINQTSGLNDFAVRPRGGGGVADDLPIRPPVINRPPEKRQRVPSAYNRFIKDEIQRIKSVNPDISHREAFSAAAKNWAHFPHIHFGLMPTDHNTNTNTNTNTTTVINKKTNVRQQEVGEDVLLKDHNGFFAAANNNVNVRVSPY